MSSLALHHLIAAVQIVAWYTKPPRSYGEGDYERSLEDEIRTAAGEEGSSDPPGGDCRGPRADRQHSGAGGDRGIPDGGPAGAGESRTVALRRPAQGHQDRWRHRRPARSDAHGRGRAPDFAAPRRRQEREIIPS